FSSVPPYRSSKETRPEFHWYNATDAESTVKYRFVVNDKPDYTVKSTDQDTLNTVYRPATALAKGTWTMHVAAFSAGGSTATAHYTVIVGAAHIEPLRIQNANEGVITQPYRLGDEYRVNWTLPSMAEIQQYVPGGEIEAVQVVRMTCDTTRTPPCEREVAATIPGNYTTLRTGEWIDNRSVDSFASEPFYRVEMVFAGAQTQDQSSVRGFSAPQDRTPQSPALPWLIGSILVAAALAAFVIWYAMRSKARAAQVQMKEEAPAGVDPETGLPTHDVKCPSCGTPFQAVGTLPLQITCPNCGVSGMLQ
ncbi:MAG: zinc ribbon domain-containing protein, partial [Thermoplasmatota archaeon]